MKHKLNKIVACLFILLNSGARLFAQENDFPINKVSEYDTNYYCTYPDRLIVGFFIATQSYGLEIKQTSIRDTAGKSHINYNADAATVNGLVFNYDKLQISFAYKTLPKLDAASKGNTRFNSIGINIGGDKWLLEANYRHYGWFYDKSTALYDTTFKDKKVYFQNPTMEVANIKLKFIYFFKHYKFSYQSAYSCNERQIKSALTPVFVGNFYNNKLFTDTSFIPYHIRSFYGNDAYVNGLQTFAYSVGGGFSGTLVIHKRFFISGLFVLGLEAQHNQFHHYDTGATNTATYINWTGDARASLGFNNRNFFAIMNLINDFSQFQSGIFNLGTNFQSISLTIGYRFKVKEPRFMPAVRRNKIYQLL